MQDLKNKFYKNICENISFSWVSVFVHLIILFISLIILVIILILDILCIYFFYFKALGLLFVQYMFTFISKLSKFIIIGIISIPFVGITGSGYDQKIKLNKNLERIYNELYILESISDKFYFNKWLWFIECISFELIQDCMSKCFNLLYNLKKKRDAIILRIKQPSFSIILIITICLILLLILQFKLTVIEPRNYINGAYNYFFIKFEIFYLVDYFGNYNRKIFDISPDGLIKVAVYPPIIEISSFVSVPFIGLIVNIILFIFLILCFSFRKIIFNSNYKFFLNQIKIYKLCLRLFFLSWILFIPVLFTLYLFGYDKYLGYIYWVQADGSYFELFKLKNLNCLNFFFKNDIWLEEKKVLMEYLKDTDIAYNMYIPVFCEEIALEYQYVLRHLIPHYTFHFDEDVNLEKTRYHTDMENIGIQFEDEEEVKPYMDICDFQFIDKFENKFIKLYNEILNLNIYNRACGAGEKFESNNLNENYKQYKILYSIYKNDKGLFGYEIDTRKNLYISCKIDYLQKLVKDRCTTPAYENFETTYRHFWSFRYDELKYYRFVKNYVNMFHDFLESQKSFILNLNPKGNPPMDVEDFGLRGLASNLSQVYVQIEDFIATYTYTPDQLEDMTLNVKPQIKIEPEFPHSVMPMSQKKIDDFIKLIDNIININGNEKKEFQVISNPFFLSKYYAAFINIDRIYDTNLFEDRLEMLEKYQYVFQNRYGFEGCKQEFNEFVTNLYNEKVRAENMWKYGQRHKLDAIATCTNPVTGEFNEYQYNLGFDHKGKPTEGHPEYAAKKYLKERDAPLKKIISEYEDAYFSLFNEYTDMVDKLIGNKKRIRVLERELSIYKDKYVNFVIYDEEYADFLEDRMYVLQADIDLCKEVVMRLKKDLVTTIYEGVLSQYVWKYVQLDLYYDGDEEELRYEDPIDYKNRKEFEANIAKNYPMKRDMTFTFFDRRSELSQNGVDIYLCDKDQFDYMSCKKKLHRLKISQDVISIDYSVYDENLIKLLGLVKNYFKAFYTHTPVPGCHTDYEGIYAYRIWPIKKRLAWGHIHDMYKMLRESQ